jgi:hypothetical protein
MSVLGVFALLIGLAAIGYLAWFVATNDYESDRR